MTEGPRFSVLVPVYHSEATLPELARRVRETFEKVGRSFEVVFVDDSVRDGAWEVLKGLRAGDERFKLVRHMKNSGQHAAVNTGLHFVSGEYVISMDDDLQDRPEDIPLLIRAIEADPALDAVISDPGPNRNSFLRSVASSAFHWLQNFMFPKDAKLRLSGFLIVKRAVCRRIAAQRFKRLPLAESILYVTDRVGNVAVKRDRRRHGKSGYTFGRLLSLTGELALFDSNLPLKVVSLLGFASATASFALMVYYLAQYVFVGVGVSGWMSLMIINLLFPGIVLFSFGIIGQYLLMIIRTLNDGHQQLVREKIGFTP